MQGVFERLEQRSVELGLGKVAVLDLEDPQLERARVAYREFLEQGRAGEMGYLERNQALRERPQAMLDGAQSALVFATGYRGEGSYLARYTQGEDYHRVLNMRLEQLVQSMSSWWPDASFLRCVDTKPVLERAFAQAAGLGFIGKHGCIIVPGWGSYVFLSVLLTTLPTSTWGAPKPETTPHQQPWDRCASCTKCLEACPTDAFVEPGILDPRKCISYLTIEYRGEISGALAKATGERIAGCDACQEVCPYNRSPSRESRIDDRQWLPSAPSGLELGSLVDLGRKGSNQYRRWIRQTALNRIPRPAMLRNVFIALGNGEALEPEAKALLEEGCAHQDQAVAKAARWALAQHGL